MLCICNLLLLLEIKLIFDSISLKSIFIDFIECYYYPNNTLFSIIYYLIFTWNISYTESFIKKWYAPELNINKYIS